jgi:hypothetical protein
VTDENAAQRESALLDRAQAEELQDRMRREEQTARALREYLLGSRPD